MKKIAIFIDGSNFNEGFKQCGIRPNYKKLVDFFAREGDIVSQCYFTALPPSHIQTPLRGIMDHLTYHGWTVVSKETKEFNGVTKGNMDVEIVVRAWAMWEYFDDLVLFSGDGDFASMVSELQRRGRRVTAVSIHNRGDRNSQMADELRRVVNNFIDLRDIAQEIKMDDDRPAVASAPSLSFLRRK